MDNSLVHRARALWSGLSGTSLGFPAGGVRVGVSPGSRMCPPDWAGIVTVAGAGIATTPDEDTACLLRTALDGVPTDSVTTDDRWRRGLLVTDVLGPAVLAYLDEPEFRPVSGGLPVVRLAAGHRDLAALLADVPEEDAEESGIAGITSPAFVIRRDGNVVAASGYREWPSSVAHIGVLTAPSERGRGLARMVASAAIADALADGLLPQWRARPYASRRVAHALGFRELGAQLSVRFAAASR